MPEHTVRSRLQAFLIGAGELRFELLPRGGPLSRRGVADGLFQLVHGLTHGRGPARRLDGLRPAGLRRRWRLDRHGRITRRNRRDEEEHPGKPSFHGRDGGTPSSAVADDLVVDDYELLDAGGGARLERFGPRVVARPHPGASGARDEGAPWSGVSLAFEPGRGWSGPDATTAWGMAVAGFHVELRPTSTGQVGLFPEQAPSWEWLRGRVTPGMEVLNLFAYTGVATLVAAAAGAAVVHVDASRPTMAWARHNAELSGLAERPIRWIVDDVAAFVAREVRRGRHYDGVVLDPPSYGHGSGGRAWRFEDDLAPLLDRCAELIDGPDGFALLTAHTPGFGPDWLAGELAASIGAPGAGVERGPLHLTARTGATLDLGAFARWPGAR